MGENDDSGPWPKHLRNKQNLDRTTNLGAHLHPGIHVVLDKAPEGLAVRGDQILLVSKGQQVRLCLSQFVLQINIDVGNER